MMKLNKQTIYLFLAGTALLLVGAFIALSPDTYLNQFNVAIDGSHSDFLSEIRGLGGCLLVFALYILSSLLRERRQTTALTLSSLVFSAFVVFRLIGAFVDGIPGQGILVALTIEIFFALGAAGLATNKKTSA